jgi:hypothetical protein
MNRNWAPLYRFQSKLAALARGISVAVAPAMTANACRRVHFIVIGSFLPSPISVY